MPPLDRPPRAKADRKEALSRRALADLDPFRREVGADALSVLGSDADAEAPATPAPGSAALG